MKIKWRVVQDEIISEGWYVCMRISQPRSSWGARVKDNHISFAVRYKEGSGWKTKPGNIDSIPIQTYHLYKELELPDVVEMSRLVHYFSERNLFLHKKNWGYPVKCHNCNYHKKLTSEPQPEPPEVKDDE